VTRIDAAREAAGKTREQLAPYAMSARDAAVHYTDEAWQRLAPHIEIAVSAVPPSAVEAAGRAAERTRGAAKSARRSARAAATQAKVVTIPAVGHALDEAVQATSQAAWTARDRGAAALPVLRGQITTAEIEALAAKHARRARRGRWARRMLVLGFLGALAGGGLAGWKWWQKQSNPDWLVEPPATPLPLRGTPAGSSAPKASAADSDGGSGSSASGLLPLDPEVEAKEAEAQHPGPAQPKPTQPKHAQHNDGDAQG
jgi:hypothetical protein